MRRRSSRRREMAARCFDFDRLGVMVCWRELMVIVKRVFSLFIGCQTGREIKKEERKKKVARDGLF